MYRTLTVSQQAATRSAQRDRTSPSTLHQSHADVLLLKQSPTCAMGSDREEGGFVQVTTKKHKTTASQRRKGKQRAVPQERPLDDLVASKRRMISSSGYAARCLGRLGRRAGHVEVLKWIPWQPSDALLPLQSKSRTTLQGLPQCIRCLERARGACASG